MKRTMTTLSIVLATVLCSAGPVPQKVTQDIARSFFAAQPETRASSASVKLLWDGMYMEPSTKSYSPAPPFYVYGLEGGEGFVVVSGDDLCRPILGYSYEGSFDPDDMPDALRDWFEMTRVIINEGNAKGLSASQSVAEEWKVATSAVSGVARDPIKKLKTALWDQREPYNRKSPILNGQRSMAGCVATAIAIVMNYWEHPKAGKGTLPSYVYSSLDDNITRAQSGHTLGHSYDWDNMLMDYSGTYTDAEADAVATLMYDLGIMIKSKWGVTITVATFQPTLYSEMMGYDKSISYHRMSDYKDIEIWYSMLRKEIDELRPVLYRGSKAGDNIGHAFVIDGYASDDYFSINWGWSGGGNGYFTLDPSGGKKNLMEYLNYQEAVFGMKPEDGTDSPLKYLLTVDKIDTDIADAVYHGESTFTVSAWLSQGVNQQLPVTNIIRPALMNGGKVVKYLSDGIECTVVGNESQYFEWEFEIPSSLTRGDYICLGFVDESGKWVKYKGSSIRFTSEESVTAGVKITIRSSGYLTISNMSNYSYIELPDMTIGPNSSWSIRDIKMLEGDDIPVIIYDCIDRHELLIRL